jgi:hypothetical protein
MGTLSARLSALEEIAEAARKRELWPHVERIAREHGVDPDRVWEIGEELRAERARIKAAGGGPADYRVYLLDRLGAESLAETRASRSRRSSARGEAPRVGFPRTGALSSILEGG